MFVNRYGLGYEGGREVAARFGLGAPSAILPAAGGAAAATGGLIAVLAGAGSALAIAGPIGAAVGGVLALLGILGVGGGCGQSCVAASNDANAVEAALKANLQAFLNGSIDQATALSNFNALWLQLQQACAQVGGGAGQNCVSDRQAGACKWQTSPGGWQQASDGSWSYVAPGAAGSGSTCWNWFVGYSDPITQAPAGALPSAGGFSASSLGPLLFFGGVGLLLAEVF